MPKYDYDSTPEVAMPETTYEHGSNGAGGRNDTMFRWLCSQRAKGASDDQITNLADAANQQCMVPPLSDRELSVIVRQVLDYESGTSGFDARITRPLSMPDIPTITSDVSLDVLEDLSWMSPVNQAKAFLCSCFDIYDVVCISGNLQKQNANQYRYVGQLLGGFDGEELPDMMEEFRPAVGGYICVNPFRPNTTRRKNENVSRYKNALVECDVLPKEEQLKRMLDIFWDLDEKPLKAIVDSGNKSYHCVIDIDAEDITDYEQTTAYIYALCEKNGLPIDSSCRNPSRMMRLPGVIRNGSMQRLVYADHDRYMESVTEWCEFTGRAVP